MSARRARSGIALVSALTLLALLGLLLAGAVASATLAQRATATSTWEAPLLGAADYAALEVLTDPIHSGLADLPLGQSNTSEIPSPTPGLRTSVVVTRLPGAVYWIVGRARGETVDSARRQVNIIARTAWIGRPPDAPFLARGQTVLGSDVLVLNDSAEEADCSVPSLPPPRQTTDSMALFDVPGSWSALAAAPGVRVIHRDTTLTSGSFEGILMVAGTLTIDGAVDLRGLVVARGRIRSTMGLHLFGAMVSQDSAATAIELHGATVRYAPCLVARLLRRASPIRVARGWGWTELF